MKMMKKLLVLSFLLIGLSSLQAQEIKWMSMNDALAAQKKTPKKILIDFYTDWCGWCKRLDKDTYSYKEVVDYVNENFYAVKFDAEGTEKVNYKGHDLGNPNHVPGKRGRNSTHQLATAFRVNAYPNTVFLDDKGNFITAVPGYMGPSKMMTVLSYLSDDQYKMTSYEQYELNLPKGK